MVIVILVISLMGKGVRAEGELINPLLTLPRITVASVGMDTGELGVINRGIKNYIEYRTVTGIVAPSIVEVDGTTLIELAGVSDINLNEKEKEYAKTYLENRLLGRSVIIEYDLNILDGTIQHFIWVGEEMVNKELIHKGILDFKTGTKYEDIFFNAYENCEIGIHDIGNSLIPPEPNVINPYVPYTNEVLLEDIDTLAKMYPSLIEVEIIGESVEGREIPLVKLGKGDIKIHLNGAIHAREYFTTTALMKMVEEYSYSYYKNEMYGEYNVREILDKVTIYIVPMVNPDGVNIALNGYSAAKNPEEVKSFLKVNPYWAYKDNEGNQMTIPFTYDWWKANARGIDLNNQFRTGWETFNRIPRPASEGFKGYEAESEPEIKALVKLLFENEFEIYSSLHTKGHLIYWTDFTVDEKEMEILKPIAEGLQKETGYTLMPSGERHTAGFSDMVRQEFNKPSFTIELTPPGLYSSFDHKYFDEEWERVKNIGIYLAERAIDMKENESKEEKIMSRLLDLDENKFTELAEALEGIILDHIVDKYTDYSKYIPASWQSPSEGGYWASWESRFSKKILEDMSGIRDLTKDEIVEFISEVIDLKEGELANEFMYSCSSAKLTDLQFTVDVIGDEVLFEISNCNFEEYERYDY